MKTTSANLNRTNTITSVFGKMLDNMRLFFFFSLEIMGRADLLGAQITDHFCNYYKMR